MANKDEMKKWRIKEYLEMPRLLGIVRRFQNTLVNEIDEINVPFGPHRLQQAIYMRPKSGEIKKPFIYYIHGGAWRRGSAETAKYAGYYFARLGYRVILASYRLAPEYTSDSQMSDLKDGLMEAINTGKMFEASLDLENNAYSFDEMIIAGQSAGGHLATLFALTQKCDVKTIGVMNISGPLDLRLCTNMYIFPKLIDYLGDIKYLSRVNPIEYLDQQTYFPKIICFHGDEDGIIEVESAQAFIEKYNEVSDNKGEIVIVHGGHHTDLAGYLLKQHPMVDRMEAWLDEISTY